MECNVTRLLTTGLFSLLLSQAAWAQSPSNATDPPGLVIVVPDEFQALLEPYAQHRRQQLPTTVVSLQQALKDTAGSDDPERLKRFLFDRFKEQRIGYVLLVGDADIMPVRYMVLDRVTAAAFDYAFYPSDLYYADLAKADGTFEDWNGRRDSFHAGYFGEVRGEKNKQDAINYDQIDYRPEIAVGRWPVNTDAEIKIVVAKSIAYESSIDQRPSEKPRLALLSVGGWVDSRGTMDRAATLMSGWTPERRYYSDRARKDGTPPPDREQLTRLLNDGVEVVMHAGHGQDDQWERCFSSQDLKDLHNAGQLPVMLSAGCSTARFATLPPYEAYVDVKGAEHRGTNFGEAFTTPPPPPAPYQRGRFNPTGLGEQLLRKGPDGAVVYIGCNTGSQPCGLTLLEGFATAAAQKSNRRVGDCWVSAVRFYYERERLEHLQPTSDWYPPSIFFQAMKFMFYGDPSLKMPRVEAL
jgi:hypothetical protein